MEVAIEGVSASAKQVEPARGAASRALQLSRKSFIEPSYRAESELSSHIRTEIC